MTKSWHNHDTIMTQFVNVICTDYAICTNYDTLQSFFAPGDPRSWCHMLHSNLYCFLRGIVCPTLLCVFELFRKKNRTKSFAMMSPYMLTSDSVTRYSSYVGKDELIFRALCVRYFMVPTVRFEVPGSCLPCAIVQVLLLHFEHQKGNKLLQKLRY